MKVRNSKEQQRQRLRREMERYLAKGGRIRQIPNGASADQAELPRGQRPLPFSKGPPASRTDLSAVVAAIDARKKKSPRPAPKKSPRRKLIYDDFGEPLRWVWDDSQESR
ncbi:hypothetical protein [Alloalcanivorax mobilis]|uniref:hypothetical protein n=1 Tax=Alloalcanivorax mobilis TaxID=2019569 RepID=UPI000B5B3626|nr:hypothetical protein [Alloalcanivorax mobilis]ASK33178.1 hypothetical protein CEK62_01640 [Alcanivorax sp. N3-2A]ASK36996.1 hypothetical protein CEK62_21835 [Alcanivorax sp. N3-2A]|tara:strand:+ start:4607 stop:4936 length:330 start_codon:yes stop_codon:yes gene_type:complete